MPALTDARDELTPRVVSKVNRSAASPDSPPQTSPAQSPPQSEATSMWFVGGLMFLAAIVVVILGVAPGPATASPGGVRATTGMSKS